jgi:D-aspartate ligase
MVAPAHGRWAGGRGSGRLKDIGTSVPVVVLTASPNPLLHGSLGITRSLGRLGVPVHAVRPAGRTPADHSRYLRSHVTATLDDDNPGRYRQLLLKLGSDLGNRPVLLPIDDRAALFVADHRDQLAEVFRFPAQDAKLAHALADKNELHRLCEQLDMPTPAAIFPESRPAVEEFAQRARFPLVVKAADPLLLARNQQARSVVIVDSSEELLAVYDQVEVAGQPNLVLQEYVPGSAESIWMFNGYFDGNSTCLIGFTGRKLRQYPTATGATSLGVCWQDSELARSTAAFLTALGYKGIVDLGYRFDARDGRHKLLDVNPRIGATFRLFVGRNGIDVARALYLDLTGQSVQASPAPDGRRWAVEHNDLLSAWEQFRKGELSLRGWARSYRGLRETAWFAADDPVPFGWMCWWSLGLARRRIAGRRRTRHRGTVPLGARPETWLAAPAEDDHQRLTTYFETQADFWRDLYRANDVYGDIYRHRHRLALDHVRELGLPQGSRTLEVGPGAGFTTEALARMGFQVEALDVSPRLLAIAGRRVTAAGLTPQVRLFLGDAHQLPFADETFSLVVALGVVPWVHSAQLAVAEMARVLRPGGYLVVSADNRRRLNHLLDPRHNPGLGGTRRFVKSALGAAGAWRSSYDGAIATFHSPAEFDEIIAAAGLERLRSSTFGFGPFTMLGRAVLSGRADLWLNTRLQRMADRHASGLQSTGAQYLVMARRPTP